MASVLKPFGFFFKIIFISLIALSHGQSTADDYVTIIVYYRPKRSCGKVMFLHVSVILFTGGSLCQGDPPPDRDPPRTETPPLPWTETPPSLDRDPPFPGQRPPSPGQRPPRTVTSGRYASYWNAFLFYIKLVSTSHERTVHYTKQIMLFTALIRLIKT